MSANWRHFQLISLDKQREEPVVIRSPSALTGQKPLTYGPCLSEPVPTIRRGSGNVSTLLSITLGVFTVSCPTASTL